MTLLQRLADVDNPRSLSNRLRAERFRRFEQLSRPLPRPIRIIDLGGTTSFWEQRGWAGRKDVFITTVNLQPTFSPHENIRPVFGDVADLRDFPSRSFDVAFSNSVIEHLWTFDRQMKMADEMRRLAPAYWLQTPNFWFPIEPHFHVPGWQWMPVAWRRFLIRRRRCGWRGPYPDHESADRAIREVRLLRRPELHRLFPGADITSETFFGLTKCWIVHAGFSHARVRRRAA